ncbi:DUF159-domain-containing protein [Backusella circina FSU 941]|nr:DUF159-domain-containing protein [Backusella circina FSU 941]
MCGRFACYLCPDDIREQISRDYPDTQTLPADTDHFTPSYNIAPSQSIPVIYEDLQGQYHLKLMTWGFVSSKATGINIHPNNVRKETLLQQAVFFDRAKRDRRCIIIAQGFYEWKTKGAQKVPYYTKRKDGKLMLFAGLYDIHQINNSPKYTCAICTTPASDYFSTIHKRMPAILDQQHIKSWLSKDVRWTVQLASTLKPYQGELDCFRVTNKVNYTRNDESDLIKPLDESKQSIFKFLAKQDSILPPEKATTTTTKGQAKVVKKSKPKASGNGLLRITDYFNT